MQTRPPSRTAVGGAAPAAPRHAQHPSLLMVCGSGLAPTPQHAAAAGPPAGSMPKPPQPPEPPQPASPLAAAWQQEDAPFEAADDHQHDSTDGEARAAAHYTRRLLLGALAGLQLGAARARAHARAAGVLLCKRQFMALAECFEAWRAAAASWRQLARRADALQERRARGLMAHALAALAAAPERRRDEQRMQTQAECYHTFVTLLASLRRWRAHVEEKQRRRETEQHAGEQQRRRAQARALAAWRQQLARRAEKQRAHAAAAGHRARIMLHASVGGWRAAAAESAERRAAAGAKVQAAHESYRSTRAACALHLWLCLSKRRKQLAAAGQELARRAAGWRAGLALRGWAARAARQRRLERAGDALTAAGARWRLRMALARWGLVAAAMQGLRDRELRERVLAAACLGTWLMFAHRRRAKAAALLAARAALARLRRRAALRGWRAVAPAMARARRLKEAAGEHHVAVARAKVVAAWRRRVAELARKRSAAGVAGAFREASSLQRGWQGWRWYCW